MNQDINYALISALYGSKTGGLYSDVYFPIIKYTIVQLFNQKKREDSSMYFTAQDVHDNILERFKIPIPNIVITKSLQKIGETKKDFVELTLMENGESFQIRKLWDSHEFDEMSEREEHFSIWLSHIEDDYRKFLEHNGTYDDGVSYLQFIADNTEEVLGYFQNSDVSVIDERYATIVFFLEYLHNTPNKKDEFNIADQLFWASIIAGYLRSEKPPVDAAEDGRMKEYFLDTSILMGLLGLSSKQKEEYAKDLREIILSSGGVMKVHPMTIEEIKIILGSVETASRPDPGTDMAEAWENHKLSITKLAKIRLSLGKLLFEHNVQIFPLLGTDECKNITKGYYGKGIVTELAAERSRIPRAYSQDNFREIHDLFMDDYIEARRKEKKDSEDIVFVTSNSDLIAFTKRLHPGKCFMISTGRIVLDLWMHNAKPAEISSCALTETMARCLDQHNTRVRSKIMEVSKFFNENKGDFDAQVYQDFIKRLYQRARNVIMTVEINPGSHDEYVDLTGRQILDAVRADQEYHDKMIAEKETENAELSARLNNESNSKEILEKTRQEHEAIISNLKKENADLAGQVIQEQKKVSVAEYKVMKEREEKEIAERRVAFYQKKEKIQKELDVIEQNLMPLFKKRENSFRNTSPKWIMGMGIILIIGAIVLIFICICRCMYWIITIGAILVTLGIFFLGRANTLNDRKEERREAAYKKWEEDNNEFRLQVKRKHTLLSELKEVEEALLLNNNTSPTQEDSKTRDN